MNKLIVENTNKRDFEQGDMFRYGEQGAVYMITLLNDNGRFDVVELGTGTHYTKQIINPAAVTRVLQVTIKA